MRRTEDTRLTAAPDPIDLLIDRIARKTMIERERIRPEGRFIDFGLDSVKALDLVVELEEAYGIEIPDRDLADLATLQDVADYVRARLQDT